ncbi:MAG TPA: nitrous oxide reductase accessory protein NosL [Vicinamibacterales bacterium]
MNAPRLWVVAVVATVILAASCGGGPPGPATLDPRHDACRFCRMTVSDPRVAAQVVAPGEEPMFFDDIGCLAAFLRQETRLPQGAVAYVADHRTRAWVLASSATFTRVDRLETPMGSHLVAYVDAASRLADPDTKGGVPVGIPEIFGPAGPPGGQAPR